MFNAFSVTQCFRDLDTTVLWVLYLRADFGLSVARRDFGAGVLAGEWSVFHPVAPTPYSEFCVEQLCASLGLTVLRDSLVLVPWSYGCAASRGKVGAAVFGFDVEHVVTSNVWRPLVLLNESSKAPFSNQPPIFSGIKSEKENEVWLYGSFVLGSQLDNSTTYVNLARVNMDQQSLIQIETMDLTSEVPAQLLAGAFGQFGRDARLFWVGGAFYSLPNGFDVLNLAGMDVSTGLWKDSTQDYDSPPAAARVVQIVFNRAGDTMTVVSSDRPSTGSHCGSSNQRLRSGMNVFRQQSVYPNPSQSEWVFDVSFVAALNVAVNAELWEPILVILVALLLIVGVSAGIFAVWRAEARRSFRYIEIPNYQAHGVQTNVKVKVK